MRSLLQVGADRYITDRTGRTAQMYAFAQDTDVSGPNLVHAEFHNIYQELGTGGPPLCALRCGSTSASRALRCSCAAVRAVSHTRARRSG